MEPVFVRSYRYRIRPGREAEFLEIQREADALYRRHACVETRWLRREQDPCSWLELQRYKDEKEAARAASLDEDEPRLKELYARFQALLDPKTPVREESFEEVLLPKPAAAAPRRARTAGRPRPVALPDLKDASPG